MTKRQVAHDPSACCVRCRCAYSPPASHPTDQCFATALGSACRWHAGMLRVFVREFCLEAMVLQTFAPALHAMIVKIRVVAWFRL
jgi:hypothetical protein